ncbi:hypothetical protein SAMN05444487_10367 [Marininema mesophilum]|uniref:CAAX prenyl protease 2/Lysostaphin resistance protein A-like domain-containing protein n=1 Tax=Marininema mesophilum TaxID=1048340 RepID=A0A1H2T9S3_9BACL|nr:CPBP family intramembrane glutamic endopeptidase [Marininema mesophilum]SDW40507.1 hypothetical protein SAMN05444487_10367 [Marininema mesophilum]
MISDTLLTFLQFVPIILLLWFANKGEARRESPEVSGIGWVITTSVLLSIGFLLLLGGGLIVLLFGNLTFSEAMPSADLSQRIPFMGLSLLLPSIIGFLLFIPAIRRGLSRPFSLDPHNRVHATSLSLLMFVFAYLFAFLSLGVANMAKISTGSEDGNPIAPLWAQQITFFFIALFGVGWLSGRRTLKQGLKRLGIVKLTLREVGIGLGAGLLLVIVGPTLEYLGQFIGISADPNVNKLTEEMLGPLYGSVLGILTLGLSAALGEETVFRGALQPRFGLLFTALIFSFVHSNYGLSLSTAIVFIVGIALGILRKRYNTTTTMIVHATYNMSLGVIAYFAAQ